MGWWYKRGEYWSIMCFIESKKRPVSRGREEQQEHSRIFISFPVIIITRPSTSQSNIPDARDPHHTTSKS